jgi:MoaA/NifB/PqqE/SkfB family radical SAM enzyme
MFDYYDLAEIHLELTQKCNASCPMCGRSTYQGKPNPHLQGHEINLQTFAQFFPNHLLARIQNLRFCGNFGDPVMATDFLEVVNHAKFVNPDLKIQIHTNGSLRPQDWWSSLAELMQGKHDRVYFALDGLADTHQLYRRGTRWEKVIENASAFIESGGHGIWTMLVFKHNEHQVTEAKKIAAKMGFADFKIKYTKRFQNNRSLKEQPIINGLEKSKGAVLPKNRSWAEIENHPICCRSEKRKSIYIAATGDVFPCCWTAAQALAPDGPGQGTEVHQLLASKANSKINLHHLNLQEILEGPTFTQSWPESFHKKMNEGRLRTCSRICGNPDRPFESQWHQQQGAL